ncbi:hypothetical protein KHQ81_05035 [Mycoplasmatota bacterium]|nr:hypothetical protein KHQ81_05035 [Mycoplasmatota bacterium]
MITNLSILENYLPIRHVSYSIGALTILVAEKLKLTFTHNIRNEEKTIYEIITSQVKFSSELKMKEKNIDIKIISNYLNEISSNIKRVTNHKD